MTHKLGKGFILIALTTLFIAAGQVLFKFASKSFEFTFSGIILNVYVWAGFVLYALGLLMLVIGLKEGELTVLFPVLSLSYIWVLIAGAILFGEAITTKKIIGTLLIVIGIAILGKYSYEKSSKYIKNTKELVKNG